jgi:hypothetical protein
VVHYAVDTTEPSVHSHDVSPVCLNVFNIILLHTSATEWFLYLKQSDHNSVYIYMCVCFRLSVARSNTRRALVLLNIASARAKKPNLNITIVVNLQPIFHITCNLTKMSLQP